MARRPMFWLSEADWQSVVEKAYYAFGEPENDLAKYDTLDPRTKKRFTKAIQVGVIEAAKRFEEIQNSQKAKGG